MQMDVSGSLAEKAGRAAVLLALSAGALAGCGSFYGLTAVNEGGAGEGGESGASETRAGAPSDAGSAPEHGGGAGGVDGSAGDAAAGGHDTSSQPIVFDGRGSGIEGVSASVGIKGSLSIDGSAGEANLERISDTEACAEVTLTTPDDYLWITLELGLLGETPMLYDAAARGVTGFSFGVSSLPTTASVHFNVSAEYANSFTFFEGPVAPTPSVAQLHFSDLTHGTASDRVSLDDPHYSSSIHRLIWELDGNGTETAYRLCISNLRALRD